MKFKQPQPHSSTIKSQILKRLKQLERKEGIRILYAVESGSRAWGFSSQDSDYDVRFIYVRRRDCYLSLEPKRDVIECPLENDLDISGWDLPKVLILFRKSNPPLYEWLQSPVVYIPPKPSIRQLKKIIPDYFSPRAGFFHYLAMAENNYKDYAGKSLIKPKKYLYVLRAIFACEWVRRFKSMPPTEFERLVAEQKLPVHVRTNLSDVLKRKMEGAEQDLKPRIAVLDEYIVKKIEVYKLIGAELPVPKELPYYPLAQTMASI